MKKIYCFLLFFGAMTLFAQMRTDSIHIAHYDIGISILDFKNQTITGKTTLQVVPLMENLPYFDLDLRSLTVDTVWLNHTPASFIHQGERLRVSVAESYQLGDTLLVTVSYGGTPSKDSRWGGFYFSDEYAFNMGVGMGDVPHNFGRVWFPCVDTFTDKSTYTFRVHTRGDHKAVCGGLLTDSTRLPDSSMVWTWNLTDPIPTYLASVAVGNYDVYRDTVRLKEGVKPIEIFAYPSVLQKVSASFINLKKVLHAYEAMFGPYRWQKVGYVTVAFNSGAMEHATNIAYPVAAVQGNLNNQSLWAHELSHAWFGNLVTCVKAEEMWINEGFASYCELLVKECLEGREAYETEYKSLHDGVLTNLGSEGFYAINKVPLDKTYGTTSYDKGALIVHSLREYLGDSLFFRGVKAMLNEYAFKNISSEQLMDCFTKSTGIDMTDFYENWINQPGFLLFSIDSIRKSKIDSTYEIYLRQRLFHSEKFAQRQKVDLTFFAPGTEAYTIRDCVAEGENSVLRVAIPFKPTYGIVDYENHFPNAVFADNLLLEKAINYNSSSTQFSVGISKVEVPVMVRVEHYPVAPDTIKKSNESIFRISNQHYWRVEYVPADDCEGIFKFRYSFGVASQPDYVLMQGFSKDKLVLLYRRDASEDWRIIPFTRSNNGYSGYLCTKQMMPGEYTFGVGNPALSAGDVSFNEIKVYPNPTLNNLKIEASAGYSIEVVNTQGKVLLRRPMNEDTMQISLARFSSGIYFVRIYDEHHVLLKTVKQVKE